MKQYGAFIVKKIFNGSDIVRGFSYKAAGTRDNYAHFGETDCFVYCSLCKAPPAA